MKIRDLVNLYQFGKIHATDNSVWGALKFMWKYRDIKLYKMPFSGFNILSCDAERIICGEKGVSKEEAAERVNRAIFK